MSADAPTPIEARRLHPMTLVQRLVVSIPALAILLLPVLRNPDANAWVSLLSAALYALFVVPVLLLQYHRFRYTITPKEIVLQSGVFTRQHRSIPIERIQNIEIEQSVLPRLLGTAKVKIETAGSTTTEGVLEYVSLDEAHHIRAVVRAYQHRQATPAPAAALGHEPEQAHDVPGEALAPPSPPTPARTLFTMPLPRVLLAGAFRFSLLYIVLVFSAMEYTGFDPEDLVDWFTRGRLQWLTDLASASPWQAAVATTLTVLLLAWLTGIAVSINRYYRFHLSLDEGKLHKRQGLLTLSEGTIPLKKVQALILRTNAVMRAFGWYALELQTMGVDAEQRGHQVAVPFAQLPDLLAVARHIRSFDLPDRFQRVSPRMIRRTLVRYVLGLLLVLLPLWWVWPPAVWGLLALPPLAGLAVLQYRHHGYALQDDFLFVRRGVVQPHLWIVPVDRFQVFYRSASLFQRRLGLASVNVDTAGAGLFRYPVVVDLPAGEADWLLDACYERFRALQLRSIEREG